jgi:hypothetical protein
VQSLTVALLISTVIASTVFAQSAEQEIKDRVRDFSGWVEIVKTAERQFKRKHDVYGNLTALRKAHLLDALVFESDDPVYAYADNGRDTCVIPKDTIFQLTVSSDGQHYQVEIHGVVGSKTLTLFADETSTDRGDCRTRHQPNFRRTAL